MTKRILNFLFVFLLIFSFNVGNVFALNCDRCGAENILDNHVCVNNQLDIEGSVLDGNAYTESGNYKITIGVLEKEEEAEATILEKYRTVISILAGVSTLTMVLFFVLNFVKLAKSADNPQQRQSAMIGIIFTGCATVILGGVLALFTFFYNFI